MSRPKKESEFTTGKPAAPGMPSVFGVEERRAFISALRIFIQKPRIVSLGKPRLELAHGQKGVHEDRQVMWVNIAGSVPCIVVYTNNFRIFHASFLRLMKEDPEMSKYLRFALDRKHRGEV